MDRILVGVWNLLTQCLQYIHHYVHQHIVGTEHLTSALKCTSHKTPHFHFSQESVRIRSKILICLSENTFRLGELLMLKNKFNSRPRIHLKTIRFAVPSGMVPRIVPRVTSV